MLRSTNVSGDVNLCDVIGTHALTVRSLTPYPHSAVSEGDAILTTVQTYGDNDLSLEAKIIQRLWKTRPQLTCAPICSYV